MNAKEFDFFRAKIFVNKSHYHDALVIIHLCYKNLPNVAEVYIYIIQPSTSLKKILSPLLFYLSSISLKNVWYAWQVKIKLLLLMEKWSIRRHQSNSIWLPDKQNHWNFIVSNCQINFNSSLVFLLIDPLT